MVWPAFPGRRLSRGALLRGRAFLASFRPRRRIDNLALHAGAHSAAFQDALDLSIRAERGGRLCRRDIIDPAVDGLENNASGLNSRYRATAHGDRLVSEACGCEQHA